jgi:hypothetical protein
MLKEKKTTMTTMYACTITTTNITTATILLHSIAIRQNRTIKKGGNEREHTYTHTYIHTIQANIECEGRRRIRTRIEIKTKREYNEYDEWKKADGVMSTKR